MSKKMIILILGIVLVIVVAGIVIFTFITLKNASKLEQYSVAGYKVGAITKVVGEQKVVSINSSVSNKVSTKSYTYKTLESPMQDLATYLNYLAENEDFVLEGNEGNNLIGGKVFAHKNADDNHVIILEIDYDTTGYTINISVKRV